MIFYLAPSKQLLYVFSILYGCMLGAVWCNNLYIVGKLFFVFVLFYHGRYIINMHALRNTQESIIRICFKNETLYLEDKAGVCFAGKLNKLCYVSKILIILQINVVKSNKDKIVLIVPDCLPSLQFRRLSMWARY